MNGSRQEKDQIQNMLNYLMPREVVDMVRYKLKIKELMANQGSMEYMTKDKEIFISNNINIIFFKYNIIDYNQPTKKFIKELSILDLLFNEGPNALNIINKGTIQIQN